MHEKHMKADLSLQLIHSFIFSYWALHKKKCVDTLSYHFCFACEHRNGVFYNKRNSVKESYEFLSVQYMNCNDYYNGGEVAKGGIIYGYRQKQISFYINFLTQFVVLLGAELFKIDTQLEP